MKALRVGDDFYINSDSIEIVQRHGTRPATREVERAKEKGTLYNAARGKQARAVITTARGWVIISPNAPDTLVSRPLINPPTKASVRAGTADEDNEDFFGQSETGRNRK